MAPTLRARIFGLLRYTDPSPAARRWRALHLTVLGIGLLAVILLSIDELPREIRHWLRVVIWAVTVVFFLEYLLRLWVAPEATRFDQQSPTMARARWAMSVSGLIGLLAVMPAAMLAGGYGITGSDTASVFCILWILKLGLHAPAFGTLSRVVSNERAPIASVLILFGIVLMLAATAAHLLERVRQPDQFGSLPGAMWWAVVTLTTTGYGDVVPHTVGGKMIGALLMISGIIVLALMTGVLATGFAQEERRREYLRVWDQVARVPIFASLGVVTLSEIVGKLRTRYYPPRITVVRRGDVGDFDVLHLQRRSRSPPAQRRIGAAGRRRVLRRDGPARTPATHRVGGDDQADHPARPLRQRFLRNRLAHSGACRGGRGRGAPAPRGKSRATAGRRPA